MNILFTLLLIFVPATAYGSLYTHTIEKHIYENYTFRYTIRIPNPNKPEFVDYIPSLMTIYVNSFAPIQYRENNFNIILYKMSWKEVKIGVRFYF